jgi:hypothetical protein
MLRFAFRVLLACFTITVTNACKTGVDPEPARDVPVTLASHDGAITILAPGESLPCPSCELLNSGFRTIHIQAVEGQTFQFKAFFGGNLRDERSCKWRGESAVFVDWINGQLSCMIWSPA